MSSDSDEGFTGGAPEGKPEKVVTFLTEKEERRVAAGKVYAEKAAAKKRERKLRYRARKAAAAERGGDIDEEDADGPMPKRSKLTLEEEEREAAKGVLKAVGGMDGAYDLAYGTGEGSVPEEFRDQFDAVLERFADEVDVPDVPKTRAEREEMHAAKLARQAERKKVAAGTADDNFDAAAAGAVDDLDDMGDDYHFDDSSDDDDDETAGTTKDFGSALDAILKTKTKGSALAGEEKMTKLIRLERAKARDASEKRELKKMVMNTACVEPSLSGQSAERKLRLVATRGVVQLFNAISKHQNEQAKQKMREERDEPQNELQEDISKEAVERSKRKATAKVSQQRFMDILKGSATKPASSSTTTKKPLVPVKKENASGKKQSGPGWDALSDDYMHKARIKDWNAGGNQQDADDGFDADADVE